MPDWWTYRLSDFLLFSPRTYYRLIELYNQAVWPGHLVALAAGCAIVALLLVRRDFWAGRAACAVLAVAWAWVGWAFLLERYDPINWVAQWFAAGFGVQAVLLLAAAAGPGGRRPYPVAGGTGRIAAGIGLFALAAYPFIAPLTGRPWQQAEVFALTPDPTAVATLGVALLMPTRIRWLLLPLPLLWCAITGATLWTMGAPEAFVAPAAAVAAIVAAAWRRYG